MSRGDATPDHPPAADLAYANAQALYRNTASALSVSIINIAIIIGFFWTEIPAAQLAAWGGITLTLTLGRIWLALRWLRSNDRRTDLTWMIALTVSSGFCWSLPLFFVNAETAPVLSYLVMFMIAGMSAGAAISFSSHMRIVLAYNLPLLLMTVGRFVSLGGIQNWTFAAVILMYLVTTTALALRNKRVVQLAHRNQLRAEAQALEIRSMAEDLQRALATAEGATLAKSRFLANMSHEIRTPLNGVLGMVQMLERSPLNDQQAEYTRTIRSSGDALLGVIDDVLDFSRIESGSVSIDAQPFDLQHVLDTSVGTVRGPASQKGLDLVLETPENFAASRLGDAQQIRQVLINLLGNAVKFTEAGQVTLTVSEPAAGEVCFDVSDTGPGLTESECALVFERFAQADSADDRLHGGAGLGLAISSELARLMSGRIDVSSVPGEGSSFRFSLPLPLACADAAEPAAASGITKPDTLQGPLTVLVVDDTLTNRMVAKAMLEHAGHKAVLAENGAQALEILSDTHLDLVLMDIQMPVMTGDEAIRRIRSSGAHFSQVPIIAVTANATSGEGERLMALGATAHASKPLNLDAVLREIDALGPPASTSGLDPTSRAC